MRIQTTLTALAFAAIPAAWWFHGRSGDVEEAEKAALLASARDEVIFTLKELKDFDGKPEHGGEANLLLAIWGRVFNVSTGAEFYAPKSGYSKFAGRDCTRALATTSTKKSSMNKDLSGLSAMKMQHLNDTYWGTYVYKYPIVGIVSDPPYNPSDYDIFAGPFEDVIDYVIMQRGLPTNPSSVQSESGRRESKCPVTRAARAVGGAIVNMIPRLLLGGGE
eukprot:TRINITY_DN16468_c0_g3_i1.p1 TRINITY_DN16468_c0_g3~~TRINITY_DN16468_c0_g3_i1.p1  ORF type:complete len:220 (+),score=36.65 TRINITY_DN16468_c0_g3_i1:87-746(+)